MATDYNQTSSICSHCDRAIPSSNIDLHYVHCSRNLEKCNVCGDMVPRQLAEEHILSTHALVSCTLCSATMERETLAVHKGESCPRRILMCDFCEFPLSAVDLIEHQEVCGNRTEFCHICRRYIRLREKIVHESMCTGVTNDPAETSSERMEREILAVRKYKLLTCDYCKFAMPVSTLNEHQEVCRNRTEQCHMCRSYIRLHEKIVHESRCNGVSDDTDESSRNTREVEKEPVPQPRQPHEFSAGPLLFTVTITGIAVLLGSLFLQRKT